MYKTILSGLLPRNDTSFSSHSISSCLLFFFELSFSSLSTGSKISDNSAVLCEDVQNGIVLHPKNYPPSRVSKKASKYGFWGGFFQTSVSRVI